MVSSVSAASGQDKKSSQPTGEPPLILLAEAKEKDGEVVLRLVNHQRRTVSEEVKGVVQTYDALVTFEASVSLKEVSPTTKAGKALEKADVLKMLGKQTKVLLFSFQPDPYYLDVFRDDIVVISSKRVGMNWKQVGKKRIAD